MSERNFLSWKEKEKELNNVVFLLRYQKIKKRKKTLSYKLKKLNNFSMDL